MEGWKFSESGRFEMRRPAGGISDHTKQILKELGLVRRGNQNASVPDKYELFIESAY
jgi:hypothetical protein